MFVEVFRECRNGMLDLSGLMAVLFMTQLTIACSELTIETLENGVKYVQS